MNYTLFVKIIFLPIQDSRMWSTRLVSNISFTVLAKNLKTGFMDAAVGTVVGAAAQEIGGLRQEGHINLDGLANIGLIAYKK